MSLNTWKKEFYSPISKVSKKDALQHSLKKWTGIRPENLKKHEVIVDEYGEICKDSHTMGITIDASSCALCKWHDGFTRATAHGCMTCPFMVHFKYRCDKGDESPYMIWENTKNPEPMIRALTELLLISKLEELT